MINVVIIHWNVVTEVDDHSTGSEFITSGLQRHPVASIRSVEFIFIHFKLIGGHSSLPLAQ